jgi:hypothetical protein
VKYIAIGIDGHRYCLGDWCDLVAAAEAACEHIDDDIVAIVQDLEE